MQSNSAKDRAPAAPVVAFFAYPGVKLLDLSGPLQAFVDVSSYVDRRCAYETIVISQTGGPVRTDTGVEIATKCVDELERRDVHTLIIPGGDVAEQVAKDPITVNVMTRLVDRSARVGSICTGAFLLAATGRLDGLPATTHWARTARLQKCYPNLDVRTGPIYLNEAKFWTSAGVTAGIDLALAFIKQDFGHSVALQLAKYLVVFLTRPGNQSQFSSFLEYSMRDEANRFADLHNWIVQNLNANLSIDVLSKRVGMSPRSFARNYKFAVGQTPAKAIEKFRLEAAQTLMVETDLPLKTISGLCGLKGEQNLRRLFAKFLGVSPLDYRHKFRSDRSATLAQKPSA